MAPLHLTGVTLVRPTKDVNADLNKYMNGGVNPDDEVDMAADKAKRMSNNNRVKEHLAVKDYMFVEDPVRGLYEREQAFADKMKQYCEECFEDPEDDALVEVNN